MNVLTKIPNNLDLSALFKKNCIEKESEFAETFCELFEIVNKRANPKALFRECFISKKGVDTISIGETTFHSRILRKKLDSVERLFAYVVTCGAELDDIEISPDDFLMKYWLDTIEQSVLESSRKYLDLYIRQKYGIEKTASMSPGAGDAVVWPIEQQKKLFSLFGDVENLIGVKLTDSFLMVPLKSVSGIIFPSEINFRSCQLCLRDKCQGRKLPFDSELWKSIQEGGK